MKNIIESILKRLVLWCVVTLPPLGLSLSLLYIISVNKGVIPNPDISMYQLSYFMCMLCTLGTAASFMIIVFPNQATIDIISGSIETNTSEQQQEKEKNN